VPRWRSEEAFDLAWTGAIDGRASMAPACVALRLVIPAKAGIQWPNGMNRHHRYWIPACGGMTARGDYRD